MIVSVMSVTLSQLVTIEEMVSVQRATIELWMHAGGW